MTSESFLKGLRFKDIENIQRNVTMTVKVIPQQKFQKCFLQWQHRWANRIAAEWVYLKVTVFSKYRGVLAIKSF
jgi:hypothetical protein